MSETIIRIPGKLVADEYGTKLANFSDLDNNVYGPYISVAAAHTALSSNGLNTVGTTVGINGLYNTVVEYWYQGGTEQANLIKKVLGSNERDAVSFDGFIPLEPVTIIEGSTSEPDAILYSRNANRFVAKKGNNYYDNWEERVLYNNGNEPYTSKLYPYNGKSYTWDGTTFEAEGAEAVRYNAQTLTAQQKEQAAQNIGLDVVVKGDVQQSFSDAQRVQAQNNMMGKAYAPAQFSGLGKKVLSKNMQLVDGVQKNVMTQAFFQDSQGNELTNTVFVIQYDYTLTENVTIPARCTLEFDGGSISGTYTITGNKTVLSADIVKIFSSETIISGTWDAAEAYPEWFGAKGDGVTDDTNAIQSTIENFVVCLLSTNYKLGHALRIEHDVILRGTKDAELFVDNTGVLILNTENFIVESFKIKSNVNNYTNNIIEVGRKTRTPGVNGFKTKKLIQNIIIQIPYDASYRDSVGILLYDTNNLGLYDVLVNNCYISGVDIAIKFYVNPGNINSNVIQNCCFHANKKAISFVRGSSGTIQCNKVINCNFQNIDSLEYSEGYNAIDIPYAEYVYNNVIDIYPWDLKCDLYTKGSSLGTIGHNVSNTKVVTGYCEQGRYVFIGTVSKGGIYGRESFMYKVTWDEGYYIISGYVKSTLDVIVETCDFYPTQEYKNISVSDLEVYIHKGTDAVYFYLKNLPSQGFRVESTSIGTLLYTKTVTEDKLNVSLLELLASGKRKSGNSTLRPTTPRKYFEYFDTTLNKPIYWTGTAWVDATGTSV